MEWIQNTWAPGRQLTNPIGSKHASRLLPGAILLLAMACLPSPRPIPSVLMSDFRPPETEMVQPDGYPPLYKWMLAPNLEPAHWLGARVSGKELVEPLNVVIVDRLSKNPEDARRTLEGALAQAGFPMRVGHSSGYFAFLDGRLQPQFPASPHRAFSNEPFEFPNDHGRVFGPVFMAGRFVFVAGFSREGISPMGKVKHRYVSFNRARDRVADRLDQLTAFKRNGFLDLRNVLAGDLAHTTGDHDGLAVVLERF